MNITGPQLAAQYERAVVDWPFVHGIEAELGLPAFVLFAIGSKETNLANIVGDYSQRADEDSPRYHGFGVIQRDLQHGIPEGWMDDVEGQFRWGGEHLVVKIKARGSLLNGIIAYNGSGAAAVAYGDDVMGRLWYLTAHYPPPVLRPREVTAMFIAYTPGGTGMLVDGPTTRWLTAADRDELISGTNPVPHFGVLSEVYWRQAGAPEEVLVVNKTDPKK